MTKEFRTLCKKYVHAFMRKHKFYDTESGEYSIWYWVSNEIGNLLSIAGYYISFDDVRYDIDNGVDNAKFFEWYDYSLTNHKKGNINYKSYLEGARHEEQEK